MESFLRHVDGGALKTQLNKIMADINVITAGAGGGAGGSDGSGGGAAVAAAASARSTEEAGRCLLEFVHFFGRVAEQHGTTPHAVLGQHVVANVFVFALERIVKPNLLTYCRVAEKHASSAMAAAATAAAAPATSTATGGGGAALRRDVLEARRRRLRGDIIRPFTQLFQCLHASLTAEGEPLTAWGLAESGSSSTGSSGSGSSGGGGGAGGGSHADASGGGYGARAEERDGMTGGGGGADSSADALADDGGDDAAAAAAAVDGPSQAPLLWKNAAPLSLLCNHILEVLESQWLVAVVGADYAQLLLEVLRWAGYARLVTPTYLVRLSQCLLSLVERVRVGEEAAAAAAEARGSAPQGPLRPPPPHADAYGAVVPGLVAQDVGDGRVWVARPSADDACVYAQALARLFALPQVTAAFPSDAATASASATRGGALGGGRRGNAPDFSAAAAGGLVVVQRVVALLQERHQRPTPDLRLEAHVIAALRHLCWRFRYDQPAAAQAPTAVVKLLCDYFFLPCHTPRHDVWRLETMQFLALVLSVAFADLVGEELWTDLQARALDESRSVGSLPVDMTSGSSVSSSTSALMTALEQPAARPLVTLLHQSVLPTTLRIFTQPRHEYSFVSRREVFSFPCATLQEVFDFGAVVVYLAGVTHPTYLAWRAASDIAPSRKRDRDTDSTAAADVPVAHGVAAHHAAPSGVVPPVQMFTDALQAEFFLPAAPLDGEEDAARSRVRPARSVRSPPPHVVDGVRAGAAAPVLSSTSSAHELSASPGMRTRRRAGAPPLVLRMGTSGLRTNTAAVQDVVSDAALFLLHLLAQPCTTLRAPSRVMDGLVEDVLLPLSGHFGLRLGPLLFAAVAAVLPRCSHGTRRYTFAAVAQRSLPAASPSLRNPQRGWGTTTAAAAAATAGDVRDAAAASLSLEFGMDEQLSPSEPAYRVLVRLLEQHLHRWPDAPRDATRANACADPLFPHDDTDAGGPLSWTGGLQLAWSAHPRSLVHRSVAQLHAWEREARLRMTAETAASDTAPLLPGTSAGRSHAPASIVADAHRSLVTASLALLLLRFAALLQCAELRALVRDGAASAAVEEGVRGGEAAAFLIGATGTAARDGDVGLTFACHVAAHGVHFYDSVPLVAHHASAAPPVGVRGGGVHRRTPTAAPASPQDDALTVLNAGTFTARAHRPDPAALFAAPAFLTWLEAAELYASTALRTHLARAQLHRHAALAASSELRDGWHGDSPRGGGAAAASRISAALHHDVLRHVERVGEAVDAALTSPATQVPAVLRDAVDAYWVLRLPLRRTRLAASPAQGPPRDEDAAVEAAEDDETGGAAASPTAATAAAALDDEVPLAPLSRSFQRVLTASVAPAAVWLMRRVQLQDCVRLGHQPTLHGGTGDAAREAPLLANTSDTDRTASIASGLSGLQLAVQCVQLLHLLVRWRRARLWAPPQEGSSTAPEEWEGDVADVADADAAEEVADVAMDGEVAASALDPPLRSGVDGAGARGGLDGADEGTYDAARRADLRLLRTSPDIYAAPAATLHRFSSVGGGRLYYVVLWLCHHVRLELEEGGVDARDTTRPTAAAVLPLPLWAALQQLFRDVGSVLLDPAFACVDPGQGILRFTAAVTRHLLRTGVERVSRWRPSNPTSREVAHVMTSALPLALDTLRRVVRLGETTGVGAFAAEPLADTAATRALLLAVLQEQHLLDTQDAAPLPPASSRPRGGAAPSPLEDALLPTTHRLLDKHPFLPPLLPALPAVLRLLPLLQLGFTAETGDGHRTAAHPRVDAACGQGGAAVVVQLLQVCFARYRYHLGPGLCSALLCGSVADVVRPGGCASRTRTVREDHRRAAAAHLLFLSEGRLVELWAAQLTDPTRVDVPVCTPAWQCALLQAAFAVLPRCEPAVAEVLGRFSFEFLSERTPHAVRQHAARQVGALFRTFSTRHAQVLHTLLTKAREGILAPTRTLCTTSLLALSEAVRAAPKMLVDVLYTLLECWAMRGFTHRPLILECLQRMAAWVFTDATDASGRASDASPSEAAPYTQLCRMHARQVLFVWLCEYRHPLAALPVECFGYATLADFVHAHVGVLMPLALLLATELTDDDAAAEGEEEGGRGRGDRHRSSSSRGTQRGGAGRPAAGREGAQLYEQVLAVFTERWMSQHAASTTANADAPRGHYRGRTRTEECGAQPTTAADVHDHDDHDHETVRLASRPSSQPAPQEVRHPDDALHDTSADEAMRRRARLLPMCLLVQQLPATIAQLLVLAAHAPVSLFAGEEGATFELLEDGHLEENVSSSSGSGNAVDGARRPGHGDATNAREGGRAGDAPANPTWAAVAQRCLYWLAAQLNTADARDVAWSVQLVHGDRAALPGQGDSASAAAAMDARSSSSSSLASAQAALRDPATCASAAAVLRCYVQHLHVWPTRRPVFDVLVAANADAVMACLVALHRTPGDPAALVYGTPDQLQRALTWVAATVTALPLPPDTAASAASTEAAVQGSCRTAAAMTIVVDATPPLSSRQNSEEATAATAAASACEARCLSLLVPPPPPPATMGQIELDRGRGEDALTRFFLSGSGTFLHALLHCVYRSGTHPAAPELLLRGPQQLALLAHVCTRWCSAAVLGAPATLRRVLTVLLHWLHRSASRESRAVVCRALLHVWPVAQHVHGRHRSGAASAGSDEPAFGACRRLLARSVAALAASSALVASTWRALCRGDPALSRCDWPQRARAYVEEMRRAARQNSDTDAGDGRGSSSHAAHTEKDADVVDVDATAAEEDIARPGRAAGDASESFAVPLADVRQRSWAAYTAQRDACLGALWDTRTQARVRRLLPLLRHVAGLREDVGEDADDGHAAAGDDAEFVVLGGGLDCAGTPCARVTVAPSVLRDVTAAVDAAPALLARCLAVAAVCTRHGRTRETSEHGAAPETRLLPPERLAREVRTAVLHAIPRLYAACVGDGVSASGAALKCPPAAGADAVGDETSDDPVSAAYGGDGGAQPPQHEAHAIAAFRLLRALSQCAVASGEPITSLLTPPGTPLAEVGAGEDGGLGRDAGITGTAAAAARDASADCTAEELVASALADAYARVVRAVEGLLWCAEVRAAERAMGALRVWALCLDARGSTDTTLSPFDAAITQLVVAQCTTHLASANSAVREDLTAPQSQPTPSAEARVHAAMRDVLRWVTRSGAERSASTVDVAAAAAVADASTLPSPAQAHLTSSSVWAPLRARHGPPNERAFLCRFVLAAANTYGLWKRSLLWTALMPLLQCELQYAEQPPLGSAARGATRLSPATACTNDEAAAGRYVAVAELLLLPVLLHALCQREGDAQRATRAAWSRLLEEHALAQPQRCPRVARLFLRALHHCHVVLLRAARQRGLKGCTMSTGGALRVRAAAVAAAAAVVATTDEAPPSASVLHSVDGATSRAAAEAVITWPSALGAVPSLQDMQECYWLNDIAAEVLARAAAAVREPPLALLFSQLSGESLFGPRTGAAALCGPVDTTRTVVLLWRDGVGSGAATRVPAAADAALNPSFGAPYSLLFPLAAPEDNPSAAALRHRSAATAAAGAAGAAPSRAGQRARERKDAIRQQTAAFTRAVFRVYAAVQRQAAVDDVVGVSAAVLASVRPSVSSAGLADDEFDLAPRLPGESLHDARGSGDVIRRSRAAEVGRGGAAVAGGDASAAGDAGGDDLSGAWLDALRRLEEMDAIGHCSAAHPQTAHAGVSRGVVDAWAAPLQRAALLLRHNLPATALDVLLSVRPTAAAAAGPSSAGLTVDGGPARVAEAVSSDLNARSAVQPAAAVPSLTADTATAPWTAAHEVSLRSLLAEAAWKCGRWSSVRLHNSTSAATGSKPDVAVHSPWSALSASYGGEEHTTASFPGITGVSRAVLDRLTSACEPRTSEAAAATAAFAASEGGSVDGFYAHLLFSFVTLTEAQPRVALQHVRRAELALRRQLSSATFATTMLAAEALSEVRACATYACAAAAAAAAARQPVGGGGSSVRHGARSPHAAASDVAGGLPAWLLQRAESPDASAPLSNAVMRLSATDYASRRLVHSVRHALCQVYGDGEAWYRVMLRSTEDAVLHHDAATAQRWLADWEGRHTLLSSMARGSAGSTATSPRHAEEEDGDATNAAVLDLQRRQLDVVLRKAQVAYGLGRWREALALLQPPAVSPPTSSFTSTAAARTRPLPAHATSVDSCRAAPPGAPQDSRVVQQLMVWHSELQLVPPSQLVRDPFLSRAAASDATGACSFLLARLCHVLADGIAQRTASHEQQQVRASVEASRQLKAELEAQLEQATTQPSATATLVLRSSAAAAGGGQRGAGGDPHGGSTGTAVMSGRGGGPAAATAPAPAAAPVILSEDQLRVVRRRIRELTADIKRQEEEWQSERSNYGLYRRSAINAYSRFLQFNDHTAAAAAAAMQHTHEGGSGGVRGAAAAAAARAHSSSATTDAATVRCVPTDPEEDIVHAVFGFVELWLNDAGVEQGGGAEVLGKVLGKAVERIPTAVFVPLASQLTAQLGGAAEGGRLAVLVARMARDFPVHVVWPLLALCHGHTFAKSRDVNALHSVDEAKIAAARQLLADLAAPTPQSGRGGGGRGGAAPEASDGDGAAPRATLVRQAQLLSEAYLELAFDRSAATAQTDKRHPIRRDTQLLQRVRHLSIPPPSSVDLFTAPVPASPTVTGPVVLRYRDYFTTPGGVNVPKVLLCELSDGAVVRQLLKAGDDLRQDALIEQVFATANRLFARHAGARPLRLRTFTVVPLSPAAGILQWVEHTMPLGEYLTGRLAGKHELPGAHERYFPGEPTTRECRMQLQSAAPSTKPQVLLGLYEKFTPALHYFFLETYTSAAVWAARQQTFTRSVAASSIMGYVVGLGDRHINNILLHRGTAEVVHIDLGIAFDQSRLLPVPELVPFRLTRNVIDGLGVRGTEGSLRPCAEAALHVLRGKRELMRTILGSIMHDPLARWAIGPVQAPSPQPGSAAALWMPPAGRAAAQDESTRQAVPLRQHGSSADAARTLARIDAKLRGYDGGDVLSVPTQVRKLMEEAQRVESLAMMFPGWSQWV